MGTSKNSFSIKSATTLPNSELRSIAEPQQWQSEFCHCTRLLQQSLLKTVKSLTIRHFSLLLFLGLARFHGRKPIFRSTLGTSKNSFTVKTALMLRNIPNIHHFSRLLLLFSQSHFAGITLTKRWKRKCSCFPPISQILYEGSLSLSAKGKCSCFLLDQFDFVFRKPNFEVPLC